MFLSVFTYGKIDRRVVEVPIHTSTPIYKKIVLLDRV